MKKQLILPALLGLLLSCDILPSNDKPETSAIVATVTTKDATEVTIHDAILNGSLHYESDKNVSCSVWFLYSDTLTELKDLKASEKKATSTLNGDESFSAAVKGLEENTEYHYVACAKVGDHEYYGDVKSFSTSEDFSNSDLVAVTINDETGYADYLIAGKDGSYILYDEDTRNGNGLVYYNPDRSLPIEDGMFIFLNPEGVPEDVVYKGEHLLFKNMADGKADMMFVRTDGSTVYLFDTDIPDYSPAGSSPAKALEWIYNTRSWDEDEKKALVPFLIKLASFGISAIGFVRGNLMDRTSLIATIAEEWEKSQNGYTSKENISFSEAYTSFGASAFWNIANDKPFGEMSRKMGLSALALLLNTYADEMLNEIGNYRQTFDEALIFEDYHIKLSPGDEHSSGTSTRINLDCGPEKGAYLINVSTKSSWRVQYDNIGFFQAGKTMEEGQMFVLVTKNDTPDNRLGIINIIAEGRADGTDADQYSGVIIVNQSANDSYFKLSNYSISVPRQGGEYTVSIVGKSPDVDYWYFWGEPGWCNVTYGKDNNSLKIKVGQYEGNRDNEGFIRITAKSKGVNRRDYTTGISIVQDNSYHGLCPDDHHPHAIDLGLGVKWACCNVGASRPEEYGAYFAWGETTTKSNYDWSTYKWGSDWDSLTKYNSYSGYGTVDNKTVLDLSDDAAHANWGGSWRMPTREEQDKLCNSCQWEWTDLEGVHGMKVTGRNGGSVFFPAAGRRYFSSLIYAGSYGNSWSSSLYTGDPVGAYSLYFNSGGVGWYGSYRGFGFPVRPVTE